MIIHQPEIFTEDEHAVVWAKVEPEKPVHHFPEYLWYRVPIRFQKYLSLKSDAFLIPMLLAGMYFSEDIEVKGTVSTRLAYNVEEYQHILSLRFQKYLRPVNVTYEKTNSFTEKPNGVGSTFTGGVDSTFTLWRHLPENQPNRDYQITHVIFFKGFDILHNEEQKYWHLYERFEQEITRLGIEMIPLETNIVSVPHTRLPLSYLYGPLIIGAGMSLAGLFHRFYIPSSWDHRLMMKKGYSSDPLLDGLLSTASFKIIHHGATHQRIEKVKEISDWELSQKLLWVCIGAGFRKDTWNCSRCEKCIRTMIPLYALGKLKKFKTFEKPFQINIDVLWWARKFNLTHNFVSETFPFVKRHKSDFLFWLYIAAAIGFVRDRVVRYLPSFVKNGLRRYGLFVNPNDAPDSYEMSSISLRIRESYDHTSS